MNNRQATLLLLVFALGILFIAGCSGGPSQPASVSIPMTVPSLEVTQPAPTRVVVTLTPTSPLVLPSATPAATATTTLVPTPTPLTVINEENGWVTYRNEIVGYEVSVPESYQIKGYPPEIGYIGDDILGPAVPDEEIAKLLARYYGESLTVFMKEPDTSDQIKPWGISIYARDILVDKLGATINYGGIGDYELTQAAETVIIEGQPFEVIFTVLQNNEQPVGEMAHLYLENGGVELMFGYPNPEDDPEAYQKYREEIWPVIRKIVESYQYHP